MGIEARHQKNNGSTGIPVGCVSLLSITLGGLVIQLPALGRGTLKNSIALAPLERIMARPAAERRQLIAGGASPGEGANPS